MSKPKNTATRRPTVRERMDASGKSRRQIAEECDCSKAYIVQIGRGQRPVTPAMLPRLARALNCKPGDLRPDLASMFEMPDVRVSDRDAV